MSARFFVLFLLFSAAGAHKRGSVGYTIRATGNAEVNMTMMQYLSAFRFFRPSVLLIALGVTVACSLLKKTALKNCPEKIRTFLPFAVGFVFYAIFRLLATGSILPLTDDYAQTLEGGFACGCAATLYYLAYEQLLCKKGNSKNPVLPLLKGIVKEEVREETAAYILGNLPDAEEARLPFLTETLKDRADGLSEKEIAAAAQAIAGVLKALLPPKKE